ncbi:hypothetical protein [Bradyrhizobium sp. LHD-71]|uniref:hypothetical protein n=1 Tax=Bradyrhizobium sp. LHD-71 TaxID=3072141 RepID=UPI00280F2DCC|nr:hypothetical protein [Bradyrhizobium sp. LHD-71]MDQ8731089.1 hypothetical protein [Bradyrhizobium sp. LHD-71]
MIYPLVAGSAGALLVIAIALRVSGRIRSMRQGQRNSVVIGISLAVLILAAAGSSLRLSAMEHLGLAVGARAIEFEIRLPRVIAAGSSKREAQVELHTDVNQTMAQLRGGAWSAVTDGRATLKGTVPINVHTGRRVLVLSMPGQPQRQFTIELAAKPDRSTEFGPWHPSDVIANTKSSDERSMHDDNFAIRYRVI